LRQWANGQRALEVQSDSVSDALQTVCTQYPAVGERILDDTGQPRQFVNVYVNGEDIRFLEGSQTALRDGDEVILAPAVAGG
jgi:molybdopterin converting factor small subunit